MLPVLLKLEFNTPTMLAVLAVLVLALMAYGFWSGWKGAPTEATAKAPARTTAQTTDRHYALWRALPYSFGTGLAGLVGAIYVSSPFSQSIAQVVTVCVWTFSGLLVLTSLLYGIHTPRKDGNGSSWTNFSVIGAAIALVAIRLGLYGGPLGRGHGLPLHTYGLMMALGFLVGIWLAAREATRAFPELAKVHGKLEPYGQVVRAHVFELGFWLPVGVIVGAKVLYLITTWDQHPTFVSALSSLFSLSGGLVFYGGFIGAILISILYCHWNRLPFLRIADVFIPSVAIGHAIGRIGCLAAGCCWGGIAKAGSFIAIRFPSAASMPWGFGTNSLAFDSQVKDHRWVDASGHIHSTAVEGAQKISEYAQSTGYTLPLYPAQLMESLGELAIFFLLIWIRRHKRFNGQLLAMWLLCYSILRFTIEFFRGDDIREFLFKYPNAIDPVILSTSQTISLGILATGIAVWSIFERKKDEHIGLQET
jgi:phosphatidylglycerol:prolipoprotein diacylglycerol transferase